MSTDIMPIAHAMVGAALTFVATYIVHKACERFHVKGQPVLWYTKPWFISIVVAVSVLMLSSQITRGRRKRKASESSTGEEPQQQQSSQNGGHTHWDSINQKMWHWDGQKWL